MKKLLEKLAVFKFFLKCFAFFAKRPFWDKVTRLLTGSSARLNLRLNKQAHSKDAAALAKTWQDLMPPDGQALFPITEVTHATAYTEIHLKCPLRGSDNVEACYKLMHYDRKLMDKVGGQLVVLESQSNSGKPFCRLAIRPKGQDISDLIPAHKKQANL